MTRTIALMLALGMPLLAARLPDTEPEPPGDAADLKAMSGVWAIKKVSGPKAADKSREELAAARFTFTKSSIKVSDGKREEPEVQFKINSKKSPKEIEITPPGGEKPLLGIYKIEKGELTLAFTEPGGERPKKFDDEKANVFTFHRPPPEKKDGKKEK